MPDSTIAEATLLDADTPMLRQTWPVQRSWPLAAAVAHTSGEDVRDDLQGLVRRLRTLETLASCPIVAVAGMLNAGKTSVVSSFLGDGGRSRALRGLRSLDGTQRFVLWLPATWKEDVALWAQLQDHLREVFGTSIELLADDADTAHAQYRNAHTDTDLFEVPLVGTDPALDDLGFAFLDCPDVQRRHGDSTLSESALRGVRLQVLGKAAQLCSAFLVVSTLDGVQDRTLHAILDEISGRAPGVRRFLLLNKLRPDVAPHEAHAELASVVSEQGLEGVFGAWDFDIPGHEKWRAAETASGFPSFYRLESTAEDNPPHSDVVGRRLQDLSSMLPTAELYADKAASLQATLSARTREAIAAVEQKAATSHSEVTEGQLGVLAACRRTLVDPEGHLRVHVDPEVLQIFVASLERTAPVYVRLFMWLNKPMRALSSAVSQGWRAAREAFAPIEGMRDRLVGEGRGALVDAGALTNALKGEDVDHVVRGVDLPAATQAALDRFAAEHRARLDGHELDEAAAAVWAALPFWQKASAAGTALTSVIAGLVAVVLIPIDMGSSVIYAASIKELLAASLVGTALGMAMEVPLRGALERRAGWPAFADLFALLCDELGLPRAALSGEPWTVAVADGDAVVPTPGVPAGVTPPHAAPVYEIDGDWASDGSTALEVR